MVASIRKNPPFFWGHPVARAKLFHSVRSLVYIFLYRASYSWFRIGNCATLLNFAAAPRKITWPSRLFSWQFRFPFLALYLHFARSGGNFRIYRHSCDSQKPIFRIVGQACFKSRFLSRLFAFVLKNKYADLYQQTQSCPSLYSNIDTYPLTTS